MTFSRRDEIRRLLSLSVEELRAAAGRHLVIVPDVETLHRHFAESMLSEIEENDAAGRLTRLVLPVGPTGQYPLLAELINQQQINLQRCWFFLMDEQCDSGGGVLPPEHPLSFRGTFERLFLERLEPLLRPPAEQVIVPDQLNVHRLAGMIEAVGGIDTTYGGIGIHGHIAYNEPEPGVAHSNPRLVELNEFTRTINAIRSEIGGNLEGYPRQGITLGMSQLLSARRIRLYCRNGIALDWANTVLRLAVLGAPGDDYPVTHIRGHADYLIVTDADTARSPRHIL